MNTAAFTDRKGQPQIAMTPTPGWSFARRENTLWAVLPAAIMIYSALLPPELRVSIADQTFYPTRLAGLALLPWLVLQLVRRPIRFILLE